MAKSYKYLSGAYTKKYSKEYSKLANDYANIMNNYNSYHQVDYSLDYGSPNINKDLVNTVTAGLQKVNYGRDSYSSSLNINEKRSGLNRFFDAISVGQYATAGFVKGLISDEMTGYEGFTRGVIAGNPLGKGMDKWEYSFSDVLEEAGWKPESTAGKIAKGALGLVGDVFLDPLNYVTGGMSGILKGTGKASVKAALKGVDVAGDAARILDNIGDISKGIGVTDDIAESIIKNSNVFKTGLMNIDVAEDVQKLTAKYNKLLGVNVGDKSISWSLANVPFGKKIFGSAADKSFTIISSDTIKAIGDITLAPGYAQLRNSVFGGKIGELFSTNHKLYKLSKTNPDAIYNFVKKLDLDKGYAKGKNVDVASIMENAKRLNISLTPAESREVLEAMENKTIWGKVQQTFKFFDTKEATKYKMELSGFQRDTLKQIDTIDKKYTKLEEELTKLYGESYDMPKILDDLANQKNVEILNIDAKFATDIGKAEDTLNVVNEAINKQNIIRNEFAEEVKNISNKYDGYKKVIADKKAGVYDDDTIKELEYVFGFKDADLFDDDVAEIAPHHLFYKDTDMDKDKLTKILQSGDTNILRNMTIDELSTSIFGSKGFISYKTYDRDLDKIFEIVDRSGNMEEAIDHIFRNKSAYTGKTATMYEFITSQMNYGAQHEFKTWDDYYTKRMKVLTDKDKAHKVALMANDINPELSDTEFQKLRELMSMDKADMTPDDFNTLHILNDKDKAFKSTYMANRNVKIPDELTNQEVAQLLKLRQEYLKREILKSQFKDTKTLSDVENVIRDFNGSLVERTFDDLKDMVSRAYDKGQSLDDTMRDAFNAVDNMDVIKDGLPKPYQKINVNTNSSLNPKQQDEILKEYVDKYRRKANVDKPYEPTPEERLIWKENAKINKKQETVWKRNQTRRKNKIEKIKELNKQLNVTDKPMVETVVNGKTLRNIDPNWLSQQAATRKLRDKYVKEAKRLNLSAETLSASMLPTSSNLNYIVPDDKTLAKYHQIIDAIPAKLESKFGGKNISELSDSQKKLLLEWVEIDVETINTPKHINNVALHDIGLAKEALKVKNKRINEFKLAYIDKNAIRNSVVEVMQEGKTVQGIIDKVDIIDGKKLYTLTVDGKTFETSTIKSFLKQGAPRNLDDAREVSELLDNFFTHSDEAVMNISEAKDKLKQLNHNKSMLLEKNEKKYNDIIEQVKKHSVELEEKAKLFEQQIAHMENNDMTKISELAEQSAEYARLLNDADAFETYVRTTVSDEFVDSVNKRYNPRAGDYILNDDAGLPPKVKTAVEWMRKEFRNIGLEEVEIHKLKNEQIAYREFDYLPHILTKEGQEFFARPEVIKNVQQFGDSYGFGKEFNDFALSRKIKFIPDGAGGWIDQPNIRQINEYFREAAGGKNVFSEDLGEIYLTRAIKHTDLMYDNKYMNSMTDLFGDAYDGSNLKEGYSVAMNYGVLKDTVTSTARKHTSLDISDAISDAIRDNKVAKKAKGWALDEIKKGSKLSEKRLVNQYIGEYVQDYMKVNMTDDIRKEFYNNRMTEVLTNTDSAKMLDDVALPLLSYDDAHISSLQSETSMLKARYEKNIRASMASFLNQPNTALNTVSTMDIAGIERWINSNLDVADDIDTMKLNRIMKRIDEYKEVKIPDVKQLENSLVDSTNRARQLQIQKDGNGLLTMYDKFTHFMKLQQTAILPAFHGRNKMSNMFNNWLGIGQDAVDMDFQKGAYYAMRNMDEASNTVLKVKQGDKVIDITWKEMMEHAKLNGVMSDGFFAQDIGAGAKTSGLLKKIGVPGNLDPTDTGNFIGYRIGTKVGSAIENHDKLIHFASQVKNGMSFSDAAESVNKYLFDYSDLTAFEKGTMKRIFPYYTWLRKNGALQLESMLEQPEKYRMVSKVIGGIENMVNEDERINKAFVNDFAKDWVQTPFYATNPQGGKEPVLWNPNLPFMDVGRLPDPFHPIDSIKGLFTQSNPLFKNVIELAANKNVFFDQPIAKDDENRFTKSLGHVAGQFGIAPIVEGFGKKAGTDLALHTLNSTTGLKLLSYDYETYKAMKIQEIIKNGNKKKLDVVGNVASAITSGFKDSMSSATVVANNIADRMNEGKPLTAGEYTNALRPISESKYSKLSPEEKTMYTPPTKDEGIAYTNKAIEMEKQAYAETGIAKTFVWTLLENMDLGERNQPGMIGEVTKVLDGDTFHVMVNGKQESVRMLLVDSPEVEKLDYETGKVKEEAMPFGNEAKQFTKDALIDKDVKLIIDGTMRDTYGRLLAYVEVDGQDFNKQLLEEGMAQNRYTGYQDNYDRQEQYVEAESKGYSQGKGIWGLEGYAEPNVDKDYSTNYDATSYNAFKKRKINELNSKKAKISVNPNPMDNILNRLR